MGALRVIRRIVRKSGGVVCGVVSLATLLGCPRGDEPKQPARVTATPTPPDTAAASNAPLQWDAAAGPAVVLPTDVAPESVVVVQPSYVEGQYADTARMDLSALSQKRFDLFGRGGAFGQTVLSAGVVHRHGNADACTAWPGAAITSARTGWQVAFAQGAATSVPLDSIEALSSADSTTLVTTVTRLAATSPTTRDSLFSSIPFVVRSAYRFHTGEIDGILATLQRSIHSEANPREEHIFLIAERPVGSSEDYHLGLITREAGAEATSPVTNVLAAVTFSANKHLAIVASNEYEDGQTLSLIERVSPGRWRMTWRSAYTGC